MASRRTALALGLAMLAGAPALFAQPAESPATFELGRGVQHSLVRVQEAWLRWVSASLQDSDERTADALRTLTIAVREVGFQRLPDLALAAAAQARESIREGDFARAEQQLAAAATLDPGLPEIADARAALDWKRGERWRALNGEARAFWEALSGRTAAKARSSLLLWTLLVLAVTAAWFVALLAWRHGGAAIAALRALISPPLPDWAALGVLAFLAIAPLALPSGVFWLPWLASILLWSFASRSERAVLALGWLLLAVAPAVADRVQRSLALDQTPPMRAWQAFESGRLYGGFFADAHVLRTALPDHPAALEFAADVHRTLGQWDVARSLYRKVLLAEPENVPVLLNLGAYAFRKSDYALANAYFLRATKAGPPSAAAWFNLSLGYSDAYMFDPARDALGSARAIDGSAVDAWMATPNPDRVLTFNGSLSRRDEVRKALVAIWERPEASRPGWLSPGVVGAALAVVALLLALGFDALRERQLAGRRRSAEVSAGSGWRHWLEALLPALDATRRGSGVTAWANLLLLAALALLPAAFEMAGDLPVASWPGPRLLGAVALLGWATYLAVRLRAGHDGRKA